MLKTILLIFRDSIIDIWKDLWTTLVCNTIWLFANLLIIPGPPATIALYDYANRKAHGEEPDHKDFWNSFKKSWGIGWRWGAINLLFLPILFIDIYLSSKIENRTLESYLVGLYIAMGLGWFLLQFFALPFLFEQDKMNVRTALRNAVVMIGRNIYFVLVILFFLVVILIIGTIVSLLSVMFGGVFIALLGNRAVLNRLALNKDVEKSS